MRFRTPMNAIVGMTSLVLETELTRDQRQYLEIARNYAESLLSVLNDILDIQPNLDADRLELDSIEFSVRKWLDDVVHTLNRQRGIFEAFRQSDGFMTTRQGATGLGLPICPRIVKLMGGQLALESDIGMGSTFHFTAQFGIRGSGREQPAPYRSDAPSQV